jgi:hypothetical protein
MPFSVTSFCSSYLHSRNTAIILPLILHFNCLYKFVIYKSLPSCSSFRSSRKFHIHCLEIFLCFNVSQKVLSLSLSLSLSIYIYIYIYIYIWLYSPLNFGRFFSFLILYTVGRTPWTGDQPVTRSLPTHRTQTQNKRTQTSMIRVGF